MTNTTTNATIKQAPAVAQVKRQAVCAMPHAFYSAYAYVQKITLGDTNVY